VEPHDSDELASAIEKLLTDADLRTRLGKLGSSIAGSRYGEAHMAEQYIAIYAGKPVA
jgi:glycosyltransferase involved in cell wall biosynthesis